MADSPGWAPWKGYRERVDPAELPSRCYCEPGERCSRCLGPLAGLLVAAQGSDGGVDLSERSGREPGDCRCGVGELCRGCVPKTFHDQLLIRLGEPWRRAPEALKQLVGPLDWLEKTAEDN